MATPHGGPRPTTRSLNWVWDIGLLDWVMMTQPSAGAGSATAANQVLEIAALGAPTDAEATGNGSIIAILKRLRTLLASPIAVSGPLTDAELRATPVPVSGSFAALGTVSTGNSTATPLAGGGTFTGTAIDCLNYTYIEVSLYSDVASAGSGLGFEWSTDNVTFFAASNRTYPGVFQHTYYTEPKARYFRVTYINGASAQATFRLQTILNSGAVAQGQLVDSDLPSPSNTPIGENLQIPMGFVVYDGTPTGAGSTARMGMAAMTNNRAIHTNLRSVGGSELGGIYTPLYVTGPASLGSSGSISANGQSVAASGTTFGFPPKLFFEVSGTYVGVLQFQSNQGGVTWTPILVVNQATGVLASSLASGEVGHYHVTSGEQIRVIATAWTSGTADIAIKTVNSDAGGWVAAIGPLTDAQLRASVVPVKEVRAATPAQSSPSVTTASTSILAANAARLGATIFNESGAVCLVKLGATASATSYSVSVAIGGYYEVPFGYTGAIDGITAVGTAVLRVTELTV